jgi:predicted PurR-regulated permease PerM
METPPPIKSSEVVSPKWSSTTKMIIGLTLGGILVSLVFYLRSIIGPLLLVAVFSYLLHPLAGYLSRHTRLSWRASVNIIYLVVIILLVGLSTAAGLVIVQQAQSLVVSLQIVLEDLPTILTELSAQKFSFGPFTLDLSQYLDVNTLSSQLMSLVQPLLGRAASLVGAVATGAANIAGWLFFVILISYFTLGDAGQYPDVINFIDLPGYSADIRRMARELGRIWNAFLRGQVIVVFLVMITFTVIWTGMGVRYALALALLAGLSRFVPYLGAWSMYIILSAVVLFQRSNYFGLEPLTFMLVVIVPTFIIDSIFDNLITPRIIGGTLRISPGAVLVVAIVAANLIGFVGLILAAPVLASVQLIARYTTRKLVDLDPWPNPEEEMKILPLEEGNRIIRRARALWRKLRSQR